MLESNVRMSALERTLDRRRSGVRFAGLLKFCVLTTLALATVLPACSTVVLMSPYDEQTDVGVTSLQKKVDGALEQLGKAPLPDYGSLQPTYAEINGDLAVLVSRNTLREKNTLTLGQLGNLSKELKILEDQHAAGSLKSVMVGPMRDSLDQTFRAILKLEISKKETGSAN